MDKRFASPIGPQAFSYYDYELLDTLYQGKDTLYHIRFFPLSAKQSWGMSGHLYVAVPDYALASVQGQVYFTWAEATTHLLRLFLLSRSIRNWVIRYGFLRSFTQKCFYMHAPLSVLSGCLSRRAPICGILRFRLAFGLGEAIGFFYRRRYLRSRIASV